MWCVLSCSHLKYYREEDVFSARGTAVVFEATPLGTIALSTDSRVMFNVTSLTFSVIDATWRRQTNTWADEGGEE